MNYLHDCSNVLKKFVVALAFFIPVNEALAQKEDMQKYLYVGRSPKDRDGFRELKPSLEVHDINNNHKLVKVIPLPASVMNIRGIFANAKTHRLYISHYGTMKGGETGYILCMDLLSNKVLWHKKYASAVDRGTITPDGATIFMPSGEDTPTDYFYVIDAKTGQEKVDSRVHVAPRTHNTICSPDNTKVFMSAFGTKMDHNWLHVVDARTAKTIRRIGPCFGTVRPFTINGKATLAFINVNKLIGFNVGDVATGKILFTANVPEPYALPADVRNATFCHGIAMANQEKEVWVVDQKSYGLHVFDVSGLPLKAPAWKQFIKTNQGNEKDKQGNFLYGPKAIYGQPGWIMGSLDGRYLYIETGEIIDVMEKKITGYLKGANGKYTHSRFAVEVDFKDGQVVSCGDQFVVGGLSR
ncbi:YncE family protein [Chitinophaga barathri]|uniref:YncE family protein n=1 Tax=Chitinophaga barathri TaxID=1647451 RepID=A0A3N4MGC0_9BACT|nr:hypothetical protein [Chitinophaga barathri]RPD43004.1 hypothetical protein EG028_01565 [Chitinophaga barathri]